MLFAAMLGLLVVLLSAAEGRAAPFDPSDDDPDAWFRLEYLNLWTSHASLGAPLVTTGDATSLGRLGFTSTQPLFGPGSLPSPMFPGMKMTLGGWLYDNLLGGEFSVFATSLRASHFNVASDAAGSPLLAVPFADVSSGVPHESSLVISQPGIAAGRVAADDCMELIGIDLDGLVSLNEHILNPNASVTLLGGVKTVTLKERFAFATDTDFLSGPVLHHNDIFYANDSFFGLDVGVRGGFRWRRWNIEATGRSAVGVSNSVFYIAGQPSMPLALSRIQTVPGEGFFAQSTNIGRYYRNAFSVLPSAQLRVGYALTDHVRLTVGYDAFFWTRVLRAPNQIDRNINTSQLIGPLIGPARPAPLTNYTNFWAQGFTAGVQISF